MEANQLKKNLKIYAYILIALLFILTGRLAIVQLWQNTEYAAKAKENRIRLLPIRATRGEIYTADGTLLAGNKLAYTLRLSNLGQEEQDNAIAELLKIVQPDYPQITEELIRQRIDEQQFRQYEPVVIANDISWETVVKLEEARQRIPGLDISVESWRTYPMGSLAGHVLGYIHSVNAEELESFSEAGYSLNSLIGKSGIEKTYEAELRGKDGANQVEVDARGRPIGKTITLAPQQGNNIYLTLDVALQLVLEDSLSKTLKNLQRSYPKAQVGSAVVMDVKTGDILAMSSKPDMFPDDWKGNISSQRALYYFPQGKYDPMNPGASLNRAIQVAYPPGSTFKPITGITALEQGAMNPNETVNCAGRYWVPPFIVCTGVHGHVNYYSAMASSCNPYFQEMGRRVGGEALIQTALDFGLGAETGVDLPFEASGLVPNPEWKKEVNSTLLEQKYERLKKEATDRYDSQISETSNVKVKQKLQQEKKTELAKIQAQYEIDFNFDTRWQEFDTFNMSLGQGANNYTVIQLANYTAAIANGGHLMRPHLVKKITSPDGKLLLEVQPEIIRTVQASAENIALTRAAMLAVTQPKGTASFLFHNFPANIQVAAKTGTAQTGRSGDKKDKEFHGVFIAFAPYDNPQIAFAGLIEYGHSGGNSAGLVAKAVFEQYFGIIDHYTPLAEEYGFKFPQEEAAPTN